MIEEKRLVLLGRNRLDHFEDLIWFRIEREQGLVLRNEYFLGRESGGRWIGHFIVCMILGWPGIERSMIVWVVESNTWYTVKDYISEIDGPDCEIHWVGVACL